MSPDHAQFWAKILSFLFSPQADLCACCVHIWPMRLLQQCWSCHKTLPLSICELLDVPCTLHTFDPACLLHPLFCYKIQLFQFFPVSLQIAESRWSDERRTTDLFFFGTYDTIVRSLVNPKIDEFLSRCLAGLNCCGISVLFCFIVPTSVNFLFFSWFARSTDVKKLSIVTFYPPLSWPEIGWTNVQMTSLDNPWATSLFSLSK